MGREKGIRDAMAKNRPDEPWFGVDDLGETWELTWDTSILQKGVQAKWRLGLL